MGAGKLILYIAVMAAVTYLVRMLPLAVFRRKIESRWIRSFLYYIPYAVLAAMTFPAILNAAQSPVAAGIGLAAAVAGAWFGLGLLPVALLACAAVLISEFFL